MTLMQVKKRKLDDNLERVKQQMVRADSIKFSFNLSRSIHRKFKTKTSSEGKEMTDIITDAIKQYLNE